MPQQLRQQGQVLPTAVMQGQLQLLLQSAQDSCNRRQHQQVQLLLQELQQQKRERQQHWQSMAAQGPVLLQ
jgi:hypothetical protein